jgi:peptide/nickel transport system permease protein
VIAFIFRRLLVSVGVVWLMSVIVFSAVYALPGNVAYMILGQYASPADIAALEQKLGLNDPLWVQYVRWLTALVHGDLGQSLSMNRPVGPLLLESLQHSSVLMCISLPLIAIVGISLGVYAAARQGSLSDRILGLLEYSVVAVPEFFWCIVGVIIFAGWLNWLPATGYSPITDGVGDWARHLVLPVATLVLGYIAHIARLTRSSMIDVLRTSYILAARAKGIPERVILLRHALPNALLPAVTVLALDVGSLIGGLVVVETVFSYPGLGWLLIFAISHQDIPIVVSGVMVVAAAYSLANLCADILYAALNPRIRMADSAS